MIGVMFTWFRKSELQVKLNFFCIELNWNLQLQLCVQAVELD